MRQMQYFCGMEMLMLYIEKLLIRYECVTVPGIGGFVLQHESAKIQEGKIIPPHTVIGFNNYLSHNDGLLISEYARQNNLNYPEAATQINLEIEKLKAKLQQGNTVLLGRMGSISRNADGTMNFKPSKCHFLPDNLGLEPIFVTAVQEQARKLTVTIPTHTNLFKYAAACAVTLFLLITPKTVDLTTTDYASLNPVDWSSILAEKQKAEMIADSIAMADVLPECIETTEAVQQEHHKFHIIVAALDKSASDIYCSDLIANGFPCAHVLTHKNGLYCVATESFRSKKEAIAAMQQLRKSNPEHNRAWVLCQ